MINKLKTYSIAFSILSGPLIVCAGERKESTKELTLKLRQNIASSSEIQAWWKKEEGEWMGCAKMIDTSTGNFFEAQVEGVQEVKVVNGETCLFSSYKITPLYGVNTSHNKLELDRINSNGFIEEMDEDSGKVKGVVSAYFMDGRFVQLTKNNNKIKSSSIEEITKEGNGEILKVIGFAVKSTGGDVIDVNQFTFIMRRKNKFDATS